MSDTDVGAVAHAASEPVTDAGGEGEVVHTPNPISTEAPVKPPSIDDALDRAEAKVKADAAKETPAPVKSEAKPEPKAEVKAETKAPVKAEAVKTEVKRDETGKFASDKPAEPVKAEPAKPSHTAGDAPARFTETAKSKWASADPEIRGEVSRMERELTEGYQKHKAAAEAFNDYRELDDEAKSVGKRGADVFREYREMERALSKDLPTGLEMLCERLGTSFKDVAAKYLNRSPEEQASKSDATIGELKRQVAALTEQVGGVTKTFETQRHEATHAEVTKFASDPAHSRFDELSDDIAFFLKTRCPGDLPKAYELAERLNPAPAQAKTDEPASSAAIDLVAQTQRGNKSISGAPGNGSSPNARKSSKSLDESLDRAFAALG
jgi:hypothetical protein